MPEETRKEQIEAAFEKFVFEHLGQRFIVKYVRPHQMSTVVHHVDIERALDVSRNEPDTAIYIALPLEWNYEKIGRFFESLGREIITVNHCPMAYTGRPCAVVFLTGDKASRVHVTDAL